jgi:hypothetical protein
MKVIYILAVLFAFGWIIDKTGITKPSVCDCNKAAMKYVMNSSNSAGNWLDCAKSYEKEIRNYGKRNGFNEVNIYDEGIAYFADKCDE